MNSGETATLHWLPEPFNWTERLTAVRNMEADRAWAALVQLAKVNLDVVRTERLARVMRRMFRNIPPAGLATPPVKLALLSSSTVEHLVPAIRVAGLRRNIWIDVYTCAYGQYAAELTDAGSALHTFDPNVVLFALDTYHLIGTASVAADPEEAINASLERLCQGWALARGNGAHVFQQTALPVFPALIGGNEHRLNWSPRALVGRFNAMLRDACEETGVDMISLSQAIEHQGLSAWHDPSLWFRAKQEIQPLIAPVYGDLVGRAIAARFGRSSKCLVLDLDNTLWGGVIGDDGLDGIVLGQGSAVGEAHLALQTYARNLSRRGIILAVCSKNDEVNALEAFENHPEMVLRRSDISCFLANWEDKATNLRTIADRLNIGIDTLVFVDDNPFERNIVRQELPMVEVPELSDDPTTYVTSVADAGYFEALVVTNDDAQRTSQYQANAKREVARTQTTDIDSYLRGLSMQMRWKPFDTVGATRIAQLVNKSNQFNLTTQRYSEADIASLIGPIDVVTLQIRLVDVFGDNGMISVIVAKPFPGDSKVADIDLWLMSCRVLGRTVEQAALNLLVAQAKAAGFERLRGHYLPTKKNRIVAQHYAKLGFTLETINNEGVTTWLLSLDCYKENDTVISVIRD